MTFLSSAEIGRGAFTELEIESSEDNTACSAIFLACLSPISDRGVRGECSGIFLKTAEVISLYMIL